MFFAKSYQFILTSIQKMSFIKIIEIFTKSHTFSGTVINYKNNSFSGFMKIKVFLKLSSINLYEILCTAFFFSLRNHV